MCAAAGAGEGAAYGGCDWKPGDTPMGGGRPPFRRFMTWTISIKGGNINYVAENTYI